MMRLVKSSPISASAKKIARRAGVCFQDKSPAQETNHPCRVASSSTTTIALMPRAMVAVLPSASSNVALRP
eukprot:14168674-Alexandrium_andersonii.AAC.1